MECLDPARMPIAEGCNPYPVNKKKGEVNVDSPLIF